MRGAKQILCIEQRLPRLSTAHNDKIETATTLSQQKYAGHCIRAARSHGGDGDVGGGGACYPWGGRLLLMAQHRSACTSARAIQRFSRLQPHHVSSRGRGMQVSPPAFTRAAEITLQHGGTIEELAQ